MIFVADESVDFVVIKTLRRYNIQIISILEISPGISDDEVLVLAFEKGAPLITFDKDFGELTIRLKKPNHGIILVRLSGKTSQEKSETILNFIEKHKNELINKFSVLHPNKIRIRTII
ncbi:MAG: DUF5615 family PIN-like protein [Bacteroidales bacterium]|nr:DUF5615 family PIN-like protein [Bacteroidales bacterium]